MSDELTFGDGFYVRDFENLHFDDKGYIGPDGIFHLYLEDLDITSGYGDSISGGDKVVLKGGLSQDDFESRFREDIAQSRLFTVSVSQILDKRGKPIVFSTGAGTWLSFLPVKNINFAFTSYDNLSVPFAALGEIPVLQRKKISTISISCYDIDDDRIEQAMIAWENRCFPKNKYVAYLEDVTSEMIYQSYGVDGTLNYKRTFYVIPAGGVQINRGYDVNSEKLITFTLAAVGEKGYSPNSLGYQKVPNYT